jgi:protocatechuate 3,4-dioxygenase beta subunit
MASNQEDLGLEIPNLDFLQLRPDAEPTESYQDDPEYRQHLLEMSSRVPVNYGEPADAHQLGPYFRPDAPFRAKITPPLELGIPLLIKGRVWAYDTKEPIARAKLDVWQANAAGYYDNEDPEQSFENREFRNRARLYCDESGYYEFETIHPGPYQRHEKTWRAPHIHFRVGFFGYFTLVTQLFFAGDPHHAEDPFFRSPLVVSLKTKQRNDGIYEEGRFDFVVVPENKEDDAGPQETS